jgi:hypothetical protein
MAIGKWEAWRPRSTPRLARSDHLAFKRHDDTEMLGIKRFAAHLLGRDDLLALEFRGYLAERQNCAIAVSTD